MPTLKIYEYQKIYVGEQIEDVVFTTYHLERLKIYQSKVGHHFFSIQGNSVQFFSWVGMLQLGDLTLEMLPKLDRRNSITDHKWQAILIEMLIKSNYSNFAVGPKIDLKSRSEKLFNFIIRLFLHELKTVVLPNGLVNKNNRITSLSGTLKGQFLMQKHLKQTPLPPTKFWTTTDRFSNIHWANRLLWLALHHISQIKSLRLNTLNEVSLLKTYFPKEFEASVSKSNFPHIDQLPSSYRYLSDALKLAHLIVQNSAVQLLPGNIPAISILLDMNRLFEEFIFQELLRAGQIIGLKVNRYLSRPFWNQRIIRPDIVIEQEEKKFILDVKWKNLHLKQPNIEDLRQIFVYATYFNADHTVLIYPSINQPQVKGHIPFHPTEKRAKPINNQILFVDVFSPSGHLKPGIGEDLLKEIGITM